MTSSNPELRSRRGVTLVELILVMVMLTILAGILVPRMSDFFPALQVRESADLLFAWARKARADAATTGVRHRLVFDDAGRNYWIVYEARPLTEPGLFQAMTGWEGQELPTDVRLEGLDQLEVDARDSGLRYLEFRPDGTANGGTLRIVNDSGDKRVLKVEKATGRVTLQEQEEEP